VRLDKQQKRKSCISVGIHFKEKICSLDSSEVLYCSGRVVLFPAFYVFVVGVLWFTASFLHCYVDGHDMEGSDWSIMVMRRCLSFGG